MTVMRSSPEILTSAREIITPALLATLTRLPDPARKVAQYHYGVTDGATASRLRVPTLVLLCATINGDPWECGREATVAMSLMGSGSAVHDDIIDEDRQRRGQPAAWTVFGVPATLQTGTALLALAFQVLAEQPLPGATEAISRMGSAVAQSCSGQITDIELEHHREITTDEWLAMVEAKTASLVSYAAALGALCAGASNDQVEAMAAYGHHVGVALQLRNDLDGIWNWSHSPEEPSSTDLRRRKKTAPVVAALQSSGPDRDRLADLYHSTTAQNPADIAAIADLIDRCGGRTWTHNALRQHTEAANKHLARAQPAPHAHHELLAYFSTFATPGTHPPFRPARQPAEPTSRGIHRSLPTPAASISSNRGAH